MGIFFIFLLVIGSCEYFLVTNAVSAVLLHKRSDFKTLVLTEDQENQNWKINTTVSTTTTPAPPPFLNGKLRSRLKTICPICTKEVLSSTLKTHPDEIIVGNGSNPYISRIDVCCEGYKYSASGDSCKCIPDCGDKCTNGICVAPNICQCFPHYVPNLSRDCVTTCPLGCINGNCLSNGTCLCSQGYRLEPKGKYCVPICDPPCGHLRNCSAPGVCSCKSGYVENLAGNCRPYCKTDCLQGNCVKPNDCQCFGGTEKRDGICQSACSQPCINGRCIAPERCLCNPGYYKDPVTHLCIPHCEKCYNGVCIAPETCRCYKGYANYHGDLSTCNAHCSGGCIGGQCYGPGKCDCSNYTMDILRQCRGTGVCLASFFRSCIWWVNNDMTKGTDDSK